VNVTVWPIRFSGRKVEPVVIVVRPVLALVVTEIKRTTMLPV